MRTGIDCIDCGESPREGHIFINNLCKPCSETHVFPPTQLDRIESMLKQLLGHSPLPEVD